MDMLDNIFVQLNKHLVSKNQPDSVSPVFDDMSILNSLQQVVFQIDTSGKWVFLNSSWLHVTSHAVSETLGTRLIDYIHPKDRINVEEYLHNLYKQNEHANLSITIRFLSKFNNSINMVLRANSIFKNNETNIAIGIIGTLTDVTEKIRQQDVLAAKYRSLRNFVNSYSGMLYRCRNDQNLTIEYASEGCLELTGYNRELLIEKNKLGYLSFIHPDDHQRIVETIQNKLNIGKQYEITHRLITATGIERWVFNKGKGNFSSSGELLSFEGVLFDYEKQRKIQERDQQQSLYDSDTKLLNRILFIDRLEHSIEKTNRRKDYSYTLLCLSIDQYSQLLESLGTQSVEFVITEVGNRIIESLNQPISLCRLQDDLFGILLDSPRNSIKNITAIVNQIQEQIQAPLSIGENEVYVTASIGVVLGHRKYKDKDSVLIEAQNALSRAISLGGARYEVSDLVTHGKAALQSHIEFELEQALEKNEFLVHWQPIVSIKNRKLTGLEARLAWPHPRQGLLYAEQFVPNAEETQLITPLWEWMLHDASRQIENWSAEIPDIETTSLNIQVTGATLLDADSIIRLREKLLSVKPNYCNLVVGVSESVLDRAPRRTRSLFKPGEGKDIQLLLDGYGRSKTSLLMLQKMSIDSIRLDHELIENISVNQQKLISGIVSLAHNLNISVVANNVRTERQLELLEKINVDFAQGEYISNPINENNTLQMLKQRPII